MDLFATGSQAGRAGVWHPRAPLESARGFLIYVSRTYTSMIPYLKGLHLTIDSWRSNWDDDGWRQKTLFNLVLRLHRLEMEGKLFIHLIWVAGTRMIAQGTDGASRGDLSNGVMSGKDMLDFVPLDLGVQDRAPDLVAWLGGAEGGFGLHWNLRAGSMTFIHRTPILYGAQLLLLQTPHWNNSARHVTNVLGMHTFSYVLP
jgi:hypothetical protein